MSALLERRPPRVLTEHQTRPDVLGCAFCGVEVLCSIVRPAGEPVVSYDVWWPGDVHVCAPEENP